MTATVQRKILFWGNSISCWYALEFWSLCYIFSSNMSELSLIISSVWNMYCCSLLSQYTSFPWLISTYLATGSYESSAFTIWDVSQGMEIFLVSLLCLFQSGGLNSFFVTIYRIFINHKAGVKMWTTTASFIRYFLASKRNKASNFLNMIAKKQYW